MNTQVTNERIRIRKIPYGTKILHGIKFYGFMVGAITLKFNSIKYYAPQVPLFKAH